MASIVSREAVMEALFAKLKLAVLRPPAPTDTKAFNYYARNWIAYNQLGDNQKPALFMLEEDEDAERRRAGMPPRRLTMAVKGVIVTSSKDLAIPAAALNPLLDAIDDILAPNPNPNLGILQQTLGGVTYDAWISGRIIKVPGYGDGIAVAVVPISVLIP